MFAVKATALGWVLMLLAASASGQSPSAEDAAGAEENGTGAAGPAEPLYFETSSQALRAVEEHVRTVAFSPDGKRLAAGHGRWDTFGAVRVWDLTTRREIKSWPLPKGVASIVISPDGKWLAYCAWDNRLRILDLKTLEHKHDMHIGPRIARLAFSPDSSQLAYATEDGVLRTLNPVTGKEVRSFGGEPYRFQYVAFSPDGTRLAAGGGAFESPSFGRTSVFNVETGAPVATLGGDQKRPVMALAWSPDGETILTSSHDAVARLWDAASGELKKTLGGHRSGLEGADFTPDGRLALTCSGDGTIRLWEVASGSSVASLTAHEGGCIDARFSPNGELIASGGNDRLVKLWHVETRQQVVLLQPTSARNDPPLPVLALAIACDGNTVATGTEDGAVRLRDMASGEVRQTLSGHADTVLALDLSSDGRRLASAGYDRTVRLWDVETGSLRFTYEGHDHWVYAVAFSPDGQTIASADFDGSIHLWAAAEGNDLRRLEGHRGPVRALEFTADGDRLISAGSDRTARVWDVESGSELFSLDGHRAAVRDIALSRDGGTIATAGDDKLVRLWNAETGEMVGTLEGHRAMVWCLAYSPGGLTLASGGFDDQVILWDLQTGRVRQYLTGHAEVVTALGFTPDGDALITGSYDETLRLWKARPGAAAPFTGHDGDVRTVAFSPDGQVMASGGHDTTIRFWSVADGRQVGIADGATGGIRTLAFSPDGALLAVGSWARIVTLWDVKTRRLIASLRHEEHDPTGLAFSRDGTRLFSSGWDGTAIIWDVAGRRPAFVSPKQSLPLTSVDLAPDGRTFATSSGNWKEPSRPGEIKLWDAATGEELSAFTGHTAMSHCVRYSPDGQRLYSIGRDATLRSWNVAERSPGEVHKLPSGGSWVTLVPGTDLACVTQGKTVLLWNLKTQSKVSDLGTHEGNIYELAVSPDGKSVASASQDSSVRLWRLPSDDGSK